MGVWDKLLTFAAVVVFVLIAAVVAGALFVVLS